MIKQDAMSASNRSVAKEKAATKQFVLIALKAKGKVAPVIHVTNLSVVLNANTCYAIKPGTVHALCAQKILLQPFVANCMSPKKKLNNCAKAWMICIRSTWKKKGRIDPLNEFGMGRRGGWTYFVLYDTDRTVYSICKVKLAIAFIHYQSFYSTLYHYHIIIIYQTY